MVVVGLTSTEPPSLSFRRCKILRIFGRVFFFRRWVGEVVERVAARQPNQLLRQRFPLPNQGSALPEPWTRGLCRSWREASARSAVGRWRKGVRGASVSRLDRGGKVRATRRDETRLHWPHLIHRALQAVVRFNLLQTKLWKRSRESGSVTRSKMERLCLRRVASEPPPPPFSPHPFLTFRVRSRPRSSSPYSKTKVGGSHVVAYRFGLKDVLAPPTLVPNPPSPELGRYMTRWPSFCLSLYLSPQSSVPDFSHQGVVCSACAAWRETSVGRCVVSHLPPRMADGGGRSQRRPSGPLPPALLRPLEGLLPSPLLLSQPAVELFLGMFGNVRSFLDKFFDNLRMASDYRKRQTCGLWSEIAARRERRRRRETVRERERERER